MGGSSPGVPTHSEVSVFGMYLDAEKSWVVLVRLPRAAVEPLQARRPGSQEELKPMSWMVLRSPWRLGSGRMHHAVRVDGRLMRVQRRGRRGEGRQGVRSRVPPGRPNVGSDVHLETHPSDGVGTGVCGTAPRRSSGLSRRWLPVPVPAAQRWKHNRRLRRLPWPSNSAPPCGPCSRCCHPCCWLSRTFLP